MNLPIKVGDEVLALHELVNINFIKIDTEGFEPFVLNGLKKTIARCRPLIFFEWTQGGRTGVELDGTYLFPKNYTFYRFIPQIVVLGLFRKKITIFLPLQIYGLMAISSLFLMNICTI